MNGPGWANNLVGILLAGVCLFSACRAPDACAQDGVACGGDPTGSWEVAKSCRDPIYEAPRPSTLDGQPKGTAREPPPEPTSSDWCSYLKYGPGGITEFIFPNDTLDMGGSLTYEADGSYHGLLTMRGTGKVELSGTCLTRFAASPTCQVLTAELTRFAASTPAYRDIACSDIADRGCLCTYAVYFDPNVNGTWLRTGAGVITHFDANKKLPSQVDYCADGTSALRLWGHNRTAIFDQPGLRTLTLGPAL